MQAATGKNAVNRGVSQYAPAQEMAGLMNQIPTKIISSPLEYGRFKGGW